MLDQHTDATAEKSANQSQKRHPIHTGSPLSNQRTAKAKVMPARIGRMLVNACTTLCKIDSDIVLDLPYRSDQRRTSSRFTEISSRYLNLD